MGNLARRPPEELSFGIPCVRHHAANVPGFGVLRVELPRRSRAIDADVRVMHYAGVAGSKLQRPDEARPRRRNWQHEGPKHVAPVGANGKWLRHRDDEIGNAQLPAAGWRDCRSHEGARRPFRRTVGDPTLNQPELTICQAALAVELTSSGHRFPRRHDSALGGDSDLRQPLPDIAVGQQAERSDFAWAVAGRTTRQDDWRDVLIERHTLTGLPRQRDREGNG